MSQPEFLQTGQEIIKEMIQKMVLHQHDEHPDHHPDQRDLLDELPQAG